MKVLVIGATGLVGRWVLRASSDRGHLATGTWHSHEEGRLRHLSLGSTRLDELLLPGERYDAGVICAGVTRIDQCKAKPAESWRVNVDGTIRLVDEMARCGIKPVFLSTDYVYSGEKGDYVETDPTDPVTEYGRQKVAVEEHLAAAGSPFLVVRLSKVISPDPSDASPLSEWYGMMVADRSIRCASDQVFCPTSVEDVSIGVVRLLETGSEGVFNLCHPRKMTRASLLMLFAEHTPGLRPRILECPTADFGFLDRRGRDTSMVPEKFLARTGFRFTPHADTFGAFMKRVAD